VLLYVGLARARTLAAAIHVAADQDFQNAMI
jgi:hypothetical protein